MLRFSFEIISNLQSHYKAPRNRLLTMEKQNKLFKVVRGLYETDKNASPLTLAGAIYGPSYISFETALAYWGWIPEKVVATMSATLGKNRTKRFETDFGLFVYRDIPQKAFPYEVYIRDEGQRQFLIAGKEKSLCDTLYRESPLDSEKQLKEYLFDNLRIEETAIDSANTVVLNRLCLMYNSTNLKLLQTFVQKKGGRK
ncbi:MAG: hypothetical protein II958_02725 [Spirochaetia bacterium]|nr:hypothetical protein [Spirochaetia bacterium]